MRDRQSTKMVEIRPGVFALRYGVYNEQGQLLRYEYIHPEDEPIDEGTAMAKSTFLKDATAQLLGGNPQTMVPDDALLSLVNIIDDKVVSGFYTGDGASNRLINLGFVPALAFVIPRNGVISSGLGGLAVYGSNAYYSQSYLPSVSIGTSPGFFVGYSATTSNYQLTNRSGDVYHFFAFKGEVA